MNSLRIFFLYWTATLVAVLFSFPGAASAADNRMIIDLALSRLNSQWHQAGYRFVAQEVVPWALTSLDAQRRLQLYANHSIFSSQRDFSSLVAAADYTLRYRTLPAFEDRKPANRFSQFLATKTRCPNRPQSSRVCTVYDNYRYYEQRESEAEKAVDDLQRGVGQEAEHMHAKRDLAAARSDWEHYGRRKEVLVALMHIQTADSLNAELLWANLELGFISAGGAAWRSNSIEPRARIEPTTTELANDQSFWSIVNYSDGHLAGSRSYALVSIERDWLDNGILNFFRWGWDAASPLADIELSDEGSCASGLAFCLAQWLVVKTGLDNNEVVGVVAARLRRNPPSKNGRIACEGR